MNYINNIHKKYIKMALEEAQNSGNDVPIGAIIVKDNEIIARASNNKEKNNDPTGHAEILVIKQASSILKNWRLIDTTIYITLEPCPMCASAILYSRIPNVVFGAYDTLYGAFGSVLNMQDYIKFKPKIIGGIMEEECGNLLKNFFEDKRERNE